MEHANHHEQQSDPHAGHAMGESAPADQFRHDEHQGHGGHGADHSGHELMFRNRFWICLVLSVPVLLYSPMLQELLNFSVPAFPGSRWIGPVFATIVFIIGGVPFLRMAVPELRNRQPGMMTLISLAIGVAFIYSVAALIIAPDSGFFWELVTLIDVMLLGHWMEMRSIRQASGALNELARLMPDSILAPAFYAGDGWGSFNSIMRLMTGLLASFAIIFWAFPRIDDAFMPSVLAQESFNGYTPAPTPPGAST